MEDKKIADNEFNNVWRDLQTEQVEQRGRDILNLTTALLQTQDGKKILTLSDNGIGMTIDFAVEEYLAMCNGIIEKDDKGNPKINEMYVKKLCKKDLQMASDELGVDISELNPSQITQISQRYHEFGSLKSGVANNLNTGNKGNYIDAISDIILNSASKQEKPEYALNKKEHIEVLTKMGIPESKIKRYEENYEKATVNTYMETKEDVEFIYLISQYYIKEKEGTLSQEEKNKITEQLQSLKNSKFAQYVLNENGCKNSEGMCDFFEEFCDARNYSDITAKLSRYQTYDKLYEDEELDIGILLLRTENAKSKINKSVAIEIAKKLGINVVSQDENGEYLDKAKIEQFFKDRLGPDIDCEDILRENDFNEYTAEDTLDRIKDSIERDGEEEKAQTVDEVNQRKASSKRREKRICSKNEEVIYNVLESQNLLMGTKGNFYTKEENTDQIVMLYCKFRQDELSEKNPEQVLDENSFKIPGRPSTNSAIIFKYMLEHREYFEKYIKDNEIDIEQVKKIEEKGGFSVSKSANFSIMYKQIKNRTDELKKRMKEHDGDLHKIESLLKEIKENGKNPELVDRLFKQVSKVPDLISNETISAVEEIDSERFHNEFDNSELARTIGKTSAKSLYYSVAKTMLKGAYALPQMLVSKKAREKYMPKFKKHIGNGIRKIGLHKEDVGEGIEITEKLDNTNQLEDKRKLESAKKPSIFQKAKALFGKKDVKLLEAGKVPENIENNSTPREVQTNINDLSPQNADPFAYIGYTPTIKPKNNEKAEENKGREKTGDVAVGDDGNR